MNRFALAAIGSLVVASAVLGVNYGLGLAVSFFTGYGYRPFLSSGSLIIFALVFVVSLTGFLKRPLKS